MSSISILFSSGKTICFITKLILYGNPIICPACLLLSNIILTSCASNGLILSNLSLTSLCTVLLLIPIFCCCSSYCIFWIYYIMCQDSSTFFYWYTTHIAKPPYELHLFNCIRMKAWLWIFILFFIFNSYRLL